MPPGVLVVDDDSLALAALADYLASHGFNVVAETDSPRALETLRQRKDIHVLVCDFEMPILNGEQLARAAKEHRRAIVVLMVSGAPPPDVHPPPWDKWFRKGPTTAAAVIQELRAIALPTG